MGKIDMLLAASDALVAEAQSRVEPVNKIKFLPVKENMCWVPIYRPYQM
jgi:hypothetical protein